MSLVSWISATDPLALVAIQAGLTGTPASEAAAAGSSQLDSDQRSLQIGEPVPIVFGRRRNGAGGVLISPGAAECRFQNSDTNDVTACYLLPLSEGELDPIQVRDVFQRSCRVGNISQSYGHRAGTWAPGNYLINRGGSYTFPVATYYCGSVGSYPGITTASFVVTIPNGFDQWKKQVHFFIRGGMYVDRLADGIIGPSDNFADLVRWMLLNIGRLPTSLIDTTALTAAATFLEVNSLACNCSITASINYSDLLTQWAPGFLLCDSNNAGKRGLRPLLPTTTTGAIDTGAIEPVFTFDEDYILPGSLQISYTSLAQRRPFVAQVIWRQQLEDDFGIIRTAEVRYSGTAPTGPYESHDLSQFCTSEAHAVKVGAYILSKRVNTTHTLRFSSKPEANSSLVTAGDVIRVRLARRTSTAGTSYHDYLYQVERITKSMAGELSYECSHFPVDTQGRSLLALDVTAAKGSGILLTSNKSGVGCDINSATDTTHPNLSWSPPDPAVAEAAPTTELGTTADAGPGGDGGGNPSDGLDGGVLAPTVYPAGQAVAGSVVSAPNPCPSGTTSTVRWFYGREADGFNEFQANLIQKGAVVVGTADMTAHYPSGDYTVRAVWYCGDGSQAVYETHVGSGRLGAADADRIEYDVFLQRGFPPCGITRTSWNSPGTITGKTGLYFSTCQNRQVPPARWSNGGGGSASVGNDVISMEVQQVYSVKSGTRTLVVDYTTLFTPQGGPLPPPGGPG